jgi:hypothetical protein
MLRSMLKEVVRVKDRIAVVGGLSSTGRGIRMPDGSPVPVETIMKEFGVSREQAEEIAKRRSG